MSAHSRFCIECGERNEARASYCGACGKPLSPGVEAQPTIPAALPSRRGPGSTLVGIAVLMMVVAGGAFAFPDTISQFTKGFRDLLARNRVSPDSAAVIDAMRALPLPEADRPEVVSVDPGATAPPAITSTPTAPTAIAAHASLPSGNASTASQVHPARSPQMPVPPPVSTAATVGSGKASPAATPARDTVDRLAAARAAARRDAMMRSAGASGTSGNARDATPPRDDAPIASGRSAPSDAPIASGRTTGVDAPIASGRTAATDAAIGSGRTSPEMTIPAGAALTLKSIDQVCTDKTRIGERFAALTQQELTGANGAVIPTGTRVVFSVDRLHRSSGGNDKTDFSVRPQQIIVNGQDMPLSAKLDTIVLKQKGRGLVGGLLGAAAGAAAAKAAGANAGVVVASAAAGGTAGALIGGQLGNSDGCIERNAMLRISLLNDLRWR